MKTIEMTGSPKNAGFKTKQEFLSKLEAFGFQHGKMTKRNNTVDILVTDDLDSETNKMTLAAQLGVQIMTYDMIAEIFSLN